MDSESDLRERLADARALLAARRPHQAIDAFAGLYRDATARGDRPVAAGALLGLAQAEFLAYRLDEAVRHGELARALLAELGSQDARQAAELVVQVEHHRRLP